MWVSAKFGRAPSIDLEPCVLYTYKVYDTVNLWLHHKTFQASTSGKARLSAPNHLPTEPLDHWTASQSPRFSPVTLRYTVYSQHVKNVSVAGLHLLVLLFLCQDMQTTRLSHVTFFENCPHHLELSSAKNWCSKTIWKGEREHDKTLCPGLVLYW